MRSVEFLIVGAGPAGLTAAHTLAQAGREALVLERNPEVGPKVCAGGLSIKAVRLLQEMGLPAGLGRTLVAHASFVGEKAIPLDRHLGAIRTISRRALGQWQAAITRQAGATIRTGARVTVIDLDERQVTIGRDERVRYQHLVGADGSQSLVRRALGLPCARRFFAAEYNIAGLDAEKLVVSFDPSARGDGYFWVFPHVDYTCFGYGADRTAVPPREVRRCLDEHLRRMGVSPGGAPLEGYPIECGYAGLDFGSVHLVGDAAGLPSPLSGEGIYPALISGREVALHLLTPDCPLTGLRQWLRIRAAHERLSSLWRWRAARMLSFRAMRTLCRFPRGSRLVTALFLA